MTTSGKDNYVKTLECLNHVCLKATPCIQAAVKTWHTNQKTNTTDALQPCLQPATCSKIKGKPSTGKGSCAKCIQWGNTVQSMYYPPHGNIGIGWQNVDSALFYDSEIEVAKAFALRLPQGAHPAVFADFDVASTMKIMMGFGEFHQHTQGHYEVIHKVGPLCVIASTIQGVPKRMIHYFYNFFLKL